MRKNTCPVCDGSTTNIFGYKCKKCNDYGILSVDRPHVVCPYCGFDHISKDVNIENDNDFHNCFDCGKEFEIKIKYLALVSTFVSKKKKKS